MLLRGEQAPGLSRMRDASNRLVKQEYSTFLGSPNSATK